MAERDPLVDIVIRGIDAPPAVLARREMSGSPSQYEIALEQLAWHLGAEALRPSVDIDDLSELAAQPSKYGQEVVDFVHRLGGSYLHTLVDIGCSSGESVMEAIHGAGLDTHVIGLDVLPEDEAMFFLPEKPAGLTFRQVTDPPTLPVESESADGVLALNVVFRTNAQELLTEIHRVLRPGGVAALSSNFKDHAKIRHRVARRALIQATEQQQAEQAETQDVAQTERLQPPADGVYFPELRRMAEEAPGLRVLGESVQQGLIEITRENVDEYLFAIWLEASRTNLQEKSYRVYRHMAADLVGRILAAPALHGTFADTVHRGVLVVQKIDGQKSSSGLMDYSAA